MCFVAVEFEDDPNVKGYCYWYLCAFKDVAVGDKVRAPLGRHNNEQIGTVRRVKFADEENAPFPLYLIKSVRNIIKESKDVQDCKKART